MNKNGYALLEITVVLIILVVLYSVIIPRIFNMDGKEIEREAVTVTLIDKYENSSYASVNGVLVKKHRYFIIYEYNGEEYEDRVDIDTYKRATIGKKTLKDLTVYQDKNGKRKYILEEHK